MINDIQVIQRAFIVACIIMAIWKCFQPQMIFGFVGDWLERKGLPLFYRYPICECNVCMTPWWGTAIYWIIWHQLITEYVVVILVAMGIGTIFSKMK